MPTDDDKNRPTGKSGRPGAGFIEREIEQHHTGIFYVLAALLVACATVTGFILSGGSPHEHLISGPTAPPTTSQK
jgi:hypothetical protein